MTEPENQLLFADEFTIEDRQFLADLNCGDEPWSRAATEWIRGSEVIDSIDKHETKVGSIAIAKPTIPSSASLPCRQPAG